MAATRHAIIDPNGMNRAFAVLLAVVMFSACAHKKHGKLIPPPPPPAAGTPPVKPIPTPAPPPPPAAGTPSVKPGYVETGLASWYGHPYHGRPAANGEIYDMETMVAAHRTLPFDTWVRVYDLDTDKTIEVRIIDRGPFVDGRIIDLSHAAAEAIAMIGPGTARVRMEVIAVPAGVPAPVYVVQVGAFQNRATADRIRARMVERYGQARVMERKENPGVWRVMVGNEENLDGANALRLRIERETGEKKAFAVRLDMQ
jgi:rare lipoprotein A